MLSYKTLRPEVKRALARAELKRRGISTNRNDPALLAAMAALRAGIAKLPAFESRTVPEGWRLQLLRQGWPITASFDEQVSALHGRIVADCLTTADQQLLNSLPPCELSPVELVGLFAEIFDTY
jgi:hypothetical protein